MWRTPPILAEYVPRRLRRRYREQPQFDIGERPRLGMDEPRVLVMAAKDAPPPVSTRRGRAAETADPSTTDR